MKNKVNLIRYTRYFPYLFEIFSYLLSSLIESKSVMTGEMTMELQMEVERREQQESQVSAMIEELRIIRLVIKRVQNNSVSLLYVAGKS